MGDLDNIFANLGPSLIAYQQGRQANEFNQQNFEWQKGVFEQNFGAMREQQQYERQLQGQIFSREDNSIQRRVADLKAAGLSPTLAAGTGARAGQPIKSAPPQMGAAQRDISGLNMMNTALLTLTGKMADVSKTLAETGNIEVQKERGQQVIQQSDRMFPEKMTQIIQQNDYAGRTMEDRIGLINREARSAAYKAEIDRIDSMWKQNIQDGIIAEFKRTGTNITPGLVQAYMGQLLLDIRKNDFAFWKELGQPMSGNATWPTTFLGLMRNLLKSSPNQGALLDSLGR